MKSDDKKKQLKDERQKIENEILTKKKPMSIHQNIYVIIADQIQQFISAKISF